ncbi:UDP-N-acetylglucosamine:LPS N-acetylglucosamine transferase [Natranaerovirga pectinivora]|uniref:UDP-N-acetylglucosamine:LPS N-acetylglucosamine transferase n=1 Tax=Natranaerovirga pectinivora TaxID=682400 RepID=A0A4R3MK71_9FIRM|nr:glycosyltransferase [Natranaerovirga pectinivora]TCT14685.1 UDP-N-acetylglucosamine:LPS N-acetylglucosamine transferase [Natranaerovirga pectinivora]
MEDKIDVLILTAQFGNGHLSVSKAIMEMIKSNFIDVNIRVQDFYKMTKPKSYKKIYKSYELLVKRGSWLYNNYYYCKEMFPKIKKFDTASFIIEKRTKNELDRLKPKVIISTFPVCSGYVSNYKEKNNIKIPLITFITDIVATNEWIYPHTDLYCVATNSIKTMLIKKGVEESKIAVTGIPIRESFYKKDEICQLEIINNIPIHKKVVTILGGGFGLLPKNEDFYLWLNNLEKAHFIISTGKNEKLYKKLENLSLDNITIVGFTNKIDEIIKGSDFLVGKPGGITLFESIISKVPFVILKPDLGQEKENCKFIRENNIGIIVNNELELKNKVKELLDDEGYIERYKERLALIKNEIDINPFLENIKDILFS